MAGFVNLNFLFKLLETFINELPATNQKIAPFMELTQQVLVNNGYYSIYITQRRFYRLVS